MPRHYSPSQLRTWLRCARAWAWRYVREDGTGAPTADERLVSSAERLAREYEESADPCSPGPYFATAIRQMGRELTQLRDWKEGATGAATIAYPPRTGPHTEEAYCAHKDHYETGSEDYRVGADVVAAAVLSVRGKPC